MAMLSSLMMRCTPRCPATGFFNPDLPGHLFAVDAPGAYLPANLHQVVIQAQVVQVVGDPVHAMPLGDGGEIDINAVMGFLQGGSRRVQFPGSHNRPGVTPHRSVLPPEP